MGVINITPNSFSDGNKYQDQDHLSSLTTSFLNFENSWVDLGAESTAPFNDPISDEQEWNRLSCFVEQNIETINKFKTVSIDTYKVATIRRFLEVFNSGIESQIVWNDISGELSEVARVLKDYPSLKYVFSHNLAPTRDISSSHMDYLCEDILESCLVKFQEALAFFKNEGIDLDRIYLDPCFGFSKTKEQNYEIIREFSRLKSLHNKWVIGVSRKSFLQDLSYSDNKTQRIIESEYFHHALLVLFMEHKLGETIFRVHDPQIFQHALSAHSHFYKK